MRQCDILIRAPLILPGTKPGSAIMDGAIAINRGEIAAIGPAQELSRAWTGAGSLHLEGQMVMPALINAHTHAAMTFLRGLADDKPLMEWLEGTVFPVEARLTEEIVRLGSLLGHAEMLAFGCGSCIDMYIYEDAVFAAAEQSGIRCMGGEAVFMFPSAACENPRQALQETERLAEKYKDHGRIRVAVNPHSVYATTPEILGDCLALAKRLDLPLHIHLAETEEETRASMKRYGKRPVPYCADLGLFDVKTIAAHLVDVNDAEIGVLAQKGVVCAHNPSSNLKLASGAAPVGAMLEAGVVVALGTDGPASNNQQNMFMEMRQAALLGKLREKNPAAISASQALGMATCGGGAAFGLPALGVLAPGAPADLIALDLQKPNMQPMLNPVSQAVYGATGHECRLTMVGGEILYRDGVFTRFNYADLLEEVKELQLFACGQSARAKNN